MANHNTTNQPSNDTTSRQGKEFQGIVVSDGMDKTIVVEVTRFLKHPRYKKYIAPSKHYKAHDEDNQCRQGDTVIIRETRPRSKGKHFTVAHRIPAQVNEGDISSTKEE